MKKLLFTTIIFLSLTSLSLKGQITSAIVSGNHAVGATLTASYGDSPEGGHTVEYEWYDSPSDNLLGTGSTYEILSSDAGNSIYLKAIEKKISDGSVIRFFSSSPVQVNSYPIASNVVFFGSLRSGMTLYGNYLFSDPDGDSESGSVYTWSSASDASGTDATTLSTGSLTYVIADNQIGRYIRFSVRPSTSGTSSKPGTMVSTAWTGPVINEAPQATIPVIAGSTQVGQVLTASYSYSDTEGDPESSSSYKWYRIPTAGGAIGDTVPIPGENGISYKLTNSDYGLKVAFAVIPYAQRGTKRGVRVSTGLTASVTNNAPVASLQSITAPASINVNDVLTGTYNYFDAEGDLEDGSVYEWWRSATTSIASAVKITSATGRSYQVSPADTGRYIFFKVTPKAQTGNLTGNQVVTTATTRVNTPPYVTNVYITGTAAIGSTLTGHHTYHDRDLDGDASTYTWYRGSVPIYGQTSNQYVPVEADEGHKIYFEVTPVSGSGYPDTGTPLKSSPTVDVIDPSSDVPVASEVCIEGIRAAGQVLKGKYKYTFPTKAEGTSVFKWYRNNIAISGATSKEYTLTTDDITSNEEIVFEVKPVSSNSTPKVGVAVKSNPLARITLLADSYSIADAAVTLTANISGGIFSGSGVSAGIFTPGDVSVTGTPTTIQYLLNIVNTNVTCSQQAAKQTTVISISSYFDGFNNVYCHDSGYDTITVKNIPPGSTDMLFRLTNTTGVVGYIGTDKIIIDPGRMRPGLNKDTLFFSYTNLGSNFPIFRPFVIDSVGNAITIVNLDTAYCEGTTKRFITAEGVYPAGGTSIWTGTLLTDQTPTSAFVDPTRGSGGNSYPLSYQYVSAYGCKSNPINRSVKIKTLPNSGFTINDTYNIDGGSSTIPVVTTGGTFVGPGVIGTIFYPEIAGQATHEIKYIVTDTYGCSSTTSHNTEVRKVMGSFNNIPSIICYRDTTYHITTTGLPTTGTVTIVDLVNSKNSVVHSGTSTSADYYVPAARAGFDTVKLIYTWDGVYYTLKKSVFIDSIGKIAITGLKDNFCDYEGTASLRVFVENSTGSGNFSFSGPDSSFTNYGNLADFYPSKTPPSTSQYKVSYTHISTVNNSGCVKKAENLLYVNKAPAVAITTSRTSVNFEEPPFVLTGTPPNGIFEGKGVYKQSADYVFNPLVAGLGQIEISLSFVDSKGCFSVAKDTLNVLKAVGTIEGINANSQYCFDGGIDELTYSGPPHIGGSFSGPGITNTAVDKANFNPALAGEGTHNIVFSYFDFLGTLFTIPVTLKVDYIEPVWIENLDPAEIFCNNDAPRTLFGSVNGGEFSGPVSGNDLVPSKGMGDTTVVFTYTSPASLCSSSITVPIHINPAAVVEFAAVDSCIANASDRTKFINQTDTTNLGIKWKWQFIESGNTIDSSSFAPSYLYKTGGAHQVRLIATTSKNCVSIKEHTLDLGKKPVPDFYWLNECKHPDPQDKLFLFDKSMSESAVAKAIWIFPGADTISYPALFSDTVKYAKNQVGYLDVRYILRTTYYNCHQDTVKRVYIRPTIPADGYSQNFENGNGSWVPYDENNNIWSFGTPNRNFINEAASGINAWFTSCTVYKQDVADTASIVSPCFDFTGVERPMMRMMLWKRFEQNSDGAVLQYKIGDEPGWTYVGTIDDGINWFNSGLIKGKPGGGTLGWTAGSGNSKDNNYVESSNKLDVLTNKVDVKFRVSYGTDGDSTGNDGMAFDDIQIINRSRGVLLEHFTGKTAASPGAATDITNVANTMEEDVINIQYHTNMGGSNAYYNDNPGDVSARVLFYGLSKVPYSYIDGGNDLPFGAYFDYAALPFDTSKIYKRSMTDPRFNINISASVTSTPGSPTKLQVSGTVQAVNNISVENLTLYIAVTQKHGTLESKEHYNIFRKFIPDAGGIVMPKTMNANQVFNLTEQIWTVDNFDTSEDMEVIVFIQNNITKHVYQAASKINPNVLVGIDDARAGKKPEFSMWPNPANGRLTVGFGTPLEAETDILIYDFSGMLVRSYKTSIGDVNYVIENAGLKQGIYLVRVISGSVSKGIRKLVISGN